MAVEMISVANAKRRFSELIDRVGRGDRFVVTRRGKPVVGLVPAAEAEQGGKPEKRGVLALMGVLEGIEGADQWAEDMVEIVASRQSARDREPPDLD